MIVKKHNKILSKLKQNDGLSYPFVVCLSLAFLIISFGVFEVIRINVISANVRNKFQAVVISESTDNYKRMYQTIREGYAASFQYNGSDWQQSNKTTKSRIVNRMNEYLSNGENGQITLDDVNYNISMTNIAPSNANTATQYNLKGQITIIIPYKFLWANLPPMRLTININSTWRQMF